jgi:hypothetical protein
MSHARGADASGATEDKRDFIRKGTLDTHYSSPLLIN